MSTCQRSISNECLNYTIIGISRRKNYHGILSKRKLPPILSSHDVHKSLSVQGKLLFSISMKYTNIFKNLESDPHMLLENFLRRRYLPIIGYENQI